eukprot:jgi/Chlat1/1787/Chrsp134S02096
MWAARQGRALLARAAESSAVLNLRAAGAAETPARYQHLYAAFATAAEESGLSDSGSTAAASATEAGDNDAQSTKKRRKRKSQPGSPTDWESMTTSFELAKHLNMQIQTGNLPPAESAQRLARLCKTQDDMKQAVGTIAKLARARLAAAPHVPGTGLESFKGDVPGAIYLACLRTGAWTEGLSLLRRHHELGLPPTKNTLVEYMHKAPDSESVVEVFEHAKQVFPKLSSKLATQYVRALCKHQDLDRAVQFAQEARINDVELERNAYNLMLICAVETDRKEVVERVRSEMQEGGIAYNETTDLWLSKAVEKFGQ